MDHLDFEALLRKESELLDEAKKLIERMDSLEEELESIQLRILEIKGTDMILYDDDNEDFQFFKH